MSVYQIRKKPNLAKVSARPWSVERRYGDHGMLPVGFFRTFEEARVEYARVAEQHRKQHSRWLEDRIALIADGIDDGARIGDGGSDKGMKAVLEHMLEHAVEWQASADNLRILRNLLEEVSQ